MRESKKIKAGQPVICQLLAFNPDLIFKASQQKTNTNYCYKKILATDHFVCLFYAVVTRNASLREVCKQIVLLGSPLMYCGLKQSPRRSTLSDANNKRSHIFFQQLYLSLYNNYLNASPFSLPICGKSVHS